MENASKALLIAGAILICILLIAIGMYVYNSANATVGSAVSQMSQQEKDIYNAKVKSYIGDTVKGSEVKSMIENVISMNQENANKSGKFISITAKNIKNYDKGGALDTACNTCNFYGSANSGTFTASKSGTGKNSEENVKTATEEMTTLKSKINSAKSYKVSAVQQEGAYVALEIDGGAEETKKSGN